jgi:hypothetical protein
MKSNVKLKLVSDHELRGPSRAFLALTRNPSLDSPRRFEPTPKREGDVVI